MGLGLVVPEPTEDSSSMFSSSQSTHKERTVFFIFFDLCERVAAVMPKQKSMSIRDLSID